MSKEVHYQTADGEKFFMPGDAFNHARTLKDKKVTPVPADGVGEIKETLSEGEQAEHTDTNTYDDLIKMVNGMGIEGAEIVTGNDDTGANDEAGGDPPAPAEPAKEEPATAAQKTTAPATQKPATKKAPAKKPAAKKTPAKKDAPAKPAQPDTTTKPE